jgi:hypothetical protein
VKLLAAAPAINIDSRLLRRNGTSPSRMRDRMARSEV